MSVLSAGTQHVAAWILVVPVVLALAAIAYFAAGMVFTFLVAMPLDLVREHPKAAAITFLAPTALATLIAASATTNVLLAVCIGLGVGVVALVVGGVFASET